MPITLRNLNNTWDSDTLMSLSEKSLPSIASVGAGVANTVVQTSITMPWNYKIRLVAIMVDAIDAVAGADSFNLVLENAVGGATGKSYTQGNIVGNDNSQTHSAANAIGTDSLGYPTNIGVAAQSVFGADVPFTSTNLASSNTTGVSGDLTGRAVPNTGWYSLAAGGGWGLFVPTNYDAVYPVGIPLGVRVTTVASTGSMTNLRITLGVIAFPRRKGPVPGSSTTTACVPATDY